MLGTGVVALWREREERELYIEDNGWMMMDIDDDDDDDDGSK